MKRKINKRKIVEDWIWKNGAANFNLKTRDIILHDGGLFSIENTPKIKPWVKYKTGKPEKIVIGSKEQTVYPIEFVPRFYKGKVTPKKVYNFIKNKIKRGEVFEEEVLHFFNKEKMDYLKAIFWFEELDETILYLKRMKKMLNKLGYKTDVSIKWQKKHKKRIQKAKSLQTNCSEVVFRLNINKKEAIKELKKIGIIEIAVPSKDFWSFDTKDNEKEKMLADKNNPNIPDFTNHAILGFYKDDKGDYIQGSQDCQKQLFPTMKRIQDLFNGCWEDRVSTYESWLENPKEIKDFQTKDTKLKRLKYCKFEKVPERILELKQQLLKKQKEAREIRKKLKTFRSK